MVLPEFILYNTTERHSDGSCRIPTWWIMFTIDKIFAMVIGWQFSRVFDGRWYAAASDLPVPASENRLLDLHV